MEVSLARDTRLTRRTFIQTLGSLSALGGLATTAPWASPVTVRARLSQTPRFGFVASSEGTIHVFSIRRGGAWTQTQTVASAAPVSLTLSPDQQFLYAANAITSFNHLPTGSVESFAVNALTGSLKLLNRQALALSCTSPRHLAVSPDGRHLAVAVAGGAYNLLPLNSDGSIGRVTASFKQIGRGAHPGHRVKASPHLVLFRDDGTLLSVDPGSHHLSTFTVTDDGALSKEAHQSTAPVGGPAHMIAHPAGGLLYVAGALEPIISSFRYHPGSSAHVKHSLELVQTLRLPTDRGVTGLAIHPSGLHLFIGDLLGISVARTNALGELELASRAVEGVSAPAGLVASTEGAHLFTLNNENGILTRFDVDTGRSTLSHPIELARLIRPAAIVLRHL